MRSCCGMCGTIWSSRAVWIWSGWMPLGGWGDRSTRERAICSRWHDRRRTSPTRPKSDPVWSWEGFPAKRPLGESRRSRRDAARVVKLRSAVFDHLPPDVTIYEVGSARRTAERGTPDLDGRQGRVHRRPVADGPARHRDHQLRESEVDSAAGGRGGRGAPDHAAARGRLFGAGAQPARGWNRR